MSSIPAQISFARNNGWLNHYYEAAAYYGIPVEILLAKDSRESMLGSAPGLLANDWYGSDGISRGISQINANENRFARETDPNEIRAYVAYGAGMLKDEIERFGDMKTALAAYNAGAGQVNWALQQGRDPDSVTHGGDYGRDVLRRAQQIKQLLTGETSPMLALNTAYGTAKASMPFLGIATVVSSLAYYIAKHYKLI